MRSKGLKIFDGEKSGKKYVLKGGALNEMERKKERETSSNYFHSS